MAVDIKKQLISNETVAYIEKLQTAYFQLNKFWDRGMSWLGTKKAMNNFVELAHPKIAHSYFFASDYFGDILDKYNISNIYGTVFEEKEEYANALDFFIGNLERNIVVYDIFVEAIDCAIRNKDYNAKVALEKLLRLHNRFIDQAYLLKDKYESVNNDALFDGFAENYIFDLDTIVANFAKG